MSYPKNQNLNRIVSYKNRTINYKDLVKVYRCLTRGPGIYSIWQHGLVRAHATHLTLVHCKFKVGFKGQQRVRASDHKNVHAYILGKISKNGAMGSSAIDGDLPAEVTYNPYIDDYFVVKNLSLVPYYIGEAMAVFLSPRGCSAAYTEVL